MKKTGFTLAEILITLTIIGIASTLVAPAITNLVPDKNKVMVLKYNTMLNNAVNEIFSNEELYHPYTGYSLTKNEATGEVTGVKRFTAIKRDDNGNDIECSGLSCVTPRGTKTIKEELEDSLKLSSGKSSDGATWTINQDDAKFYISIKISSSNGCGSYSSSNCSKISKVDTFKFYINEDGVIKPNDPLTEAYVTNPTNTHSIKEDSASAKSLASKTYETYTPKQ